MKYLYVIVFLSACLICQHASAADSASGQPLSPQAQKLEKQCNLEARNSLIHGDTALVEEACMQAVKEIEKSRSDKKYLINPILNLAYSYTLAGQFDKAEPLYSRARHIGEQVYEADSKHLKEIDRLIGVKEEMKRQHRK